MSFCAAKRSHHPTVGDDSRCRAYAGTRTLTVTKMRLPERPRQRGYATSAVSRKTMKGQTPLTSLTDTDQTVSVQPSYVRGRRAVRYMPARKPEPWFRLWATVCDICFPHHFPPAAHSHWHASDIGFLRRDSRSANVAVVFSRSFIMAISVLGRPLATWILYR